MPDDQKYMHKIRSVQPGSIADQLGVEAGDCLLTVNDRVVEDVFDYRYLTQVEELTIVIRKGTKADRSSGTQDSDARDKEAEDEDKDRQNADDEAGDTPDREKEDFEAWSEEADDEEADDEEADDEEAGDEEADDEEARVEEADDEEAGDEDVEEWELEIEKDPSEDLGIEFESGLMDEYRSCRNRCIFCFVNQMPKGMRSTLYFHDDDARLSFLQGNYITLTNMSDHDIDRIIRYHLEPINISFHTMNPQLRCEMLHNRTAGDVFPKIMRLKEAGIELNGQIVLCRGINDGEELEYSLRMFEQYLPELRSVSVVPVGLTKYRERLPHLDPFTGEDAGPVIDQIERWQRYYYEKYGTHLVHASDEWYILAGRALPPEENYDGYLQLENGVGMTRLLIEEVREALEDDCRTEPVCAPAPDTGMTAPAGGSPASDTGMTAPAGGSQASGAGSGLFSRHVTIACGTLIGPVIRDLASQITQKYPQVRADVVPIVNHFFGELITVSGLITGQDLTAQLKGRDLGEELLIPSSMLRSGESVLLDDMTVEQVEETLQIKIRIVESDGHSFVEAVTGMVSGEDPSRGTGPDEEPETED